MELIAPKTTVLYDYDSLHYYISIWWSIENGAPWVGKGYAPCSPVHKNSVSSRQWDASTSILDDELEKNTAHIISDCMDRLDAVERALITYGECGVLTRWVSDIEPARAQLRYELALVKLANDARRNGVDV